MSADYGGRAGKVFVHNRAYVDAFGPNGPIGFDARTDAAAIEGSSLERGGFLENVPVHITHRPSQIIDRRCRLSWVTVEGRRHFP
ncbi:hypothetical protein N5K21_29270, partial [Rhizobium pusense]|uniref:hypothetical protein n=1 Tax=Agrobacterium pusense TaxID=648995 RepID=UPI00244CDFC5